VCEIGFEKLPGHHARECARCKNKKKEVLGGEARAARGWEKTNSQKGLPPEKGVVDKERPVRKKAELCMQKSQGDTQRIKEKKLFDVLKNR